MSRKIDGKLSGLTGAIWLGGLAGVVTEAQTNTTLTSDGAWTA